MERIRLILDGNAAFSALSGAVLMLGAAARGATLGLPTWFLAVTGISLVSYGALLWWLARRPDVIVGARFATIMDAGWVLGAAIVLLGHPEVMTSGGRAALLTVSLVVLGFVAAQFLALRRVGGREASSVAIG
jgi:hypothetical protein